MLHTDKARKTLYTTSALYVAVIVTLIVTTFYPSPVEGVSISLMLAVKLLPLLPFAPTVFRGYNRGYIWLSFVVIFYFTQAVVQAWLSEGGIIQLLLAVLTFLLFTVAMIHLKVNRPGPA